MGVHATIVAVEKTMIITYYQSVFVALDIQHAMCMSHIVICDLCPVLQHFSTLSNKSHDFLKKKIG